VPTAIKVFNWIATLYKGGIIVYNTRCWYALAFLWTFTIGGLTGHLPRHAGHRRAPPRHLLRGRPLPLRDDGRHRHRVLGGIHHWWPKMTGRMYNEAAGKFGCLLVFIGFNVTFLTQFFLGRRACRAATTPTCPSTS
jgi:cytochrome c oxidase subunit 1